ncbi:hypothetical protein CCAX7_16810 [Capsulimonas corticalis]|uniref:Uncharacterized protein n=1 Tax=Capsulimonas corticalis TaxID=2219043 RepID=A0A402CYR5_9BACT|nr:hypothetical protein [Capsulimonas corticalis]BDI29630.1 hypothetical protein CCAX7_16810 [Capsulimonas corticalis]
MNTRPWSRGLRTLSASAVLFLASMSAHAQTFHVDFSKESGPPLLKTKFGVYQTPFFFKTSPPSAFDMTGLLREAGVQDLRYEMAWGKSDAYAYDQISGSAADPRIDFSRLDPFLGQLARAGVTPLLAMTYDPLPLKTGTDWQRWKDAPSDLAAWGQINRRYAEHYRGLGLRAPFYEMWNEPDLPGDGGKVFFNGGPEDYGRVARAGLAGVHAGDPDAHAGGPAMAYDAGYARSILSDPIDFISVHAYNNFPIQVGAIARGAVKDRPDLPILLTEYASFTEFGLQKPNSRSVAAERFFRDARGLLTYSDTPKVYWAQWIDDDLGMVTHDLHRKALFHAFQIYQTMLPVDRSPVSPDGRDGVGLLAASDDHNAGVVLWNENTSPKTVTAILDKLPFAKGALRVYRIDAAHASYVDDPAHEALAVETTQSLTSSGASWTGEIPGEGVVFLRISDGAGQSLLRPASLGTFVKSLYWFPDRTTDGWADFDPQTSIARLGMGGRAMGIQQIGAVIDRPAPRWRVQVRRRGPFVPQSGNALFALRLDYGSKRGGYSKSILWRDDSRQTVRTSAFPWGRKTTTPDVLHVEKALRTGKAFEISVAREAPADWSHRVLVTPILEDMGAGSQVRIILKAM